MHALICYDVASDRRRRRLVRLLQGYGERLHESAFRVRLRPAQMTALQKQLARSVDARADRVTVYPLCDRDLPDAVHLGISPPEPLPCNWVV